MSLHPVAIADSTHHSNQNERGTAAVDNLRDRICRFHTWVLMNETLSDEMKSELRTLEADMLRLGGDEGGKDSATGIRPLTAGPGGNRFQLSNGMPGANLAQSPFRQSLHPVRRSAIQDLSHRLQQIDDLVSHRVDPNPAQSHTKRRGDPPPYENARESTFLRTKGERRTWDSCSSVWSKSTAPNQRESREESEMKISGQLAEMVLERFSKATTSASHRSRRFSNFTMDTAPALPTPLFRPPSHPDQEDEIISFIPPELSSEPSTPQSCVVPKTLGKSRAAVAITVPPRASTGSGMPSARRLLSPELQNTVGRGSQTADVRIRRAWPTNAI